MKKLLLLCVVALCSACVSKQEILEYQITSACEQVYNNGSFVFEQKSIESEEINNLPQYDSICRHYANEHYRLKNDTEKKLRDFSWGSDKKTKAELEEIENVSNDSLLYYKSMVLARIAQIDKTTPLGWVIRHFYNLIPKDRVTNIPMRDRALKIYETTVIGLDDKIVTQYTGAHIDRFILDCEDEIGQ